MLKYFVLCTALIISGCALGAYAADATKDDSVSHRDKKFVETAAETGTAEVLAADLAIKKTANEEVKAFAIAMQADHTKANEALDQIAVTKNIALPTDRTHHDNKMLDKLSKLEGVEFDKAYINDQVNAHEDAVNLFQKEADKGEDNDVKAFAAATLPTLQHHLEMVKDIQAKLNATAGNK